MRAMAGAIVIGGTTPCGSARGRDTGAYSGINFAG
jgi:hypothetical protein